MRGGRFRAITVVLLAVGSVVPATASAESFGSRTLERGSRGGDVRVLQRSLTKVGYRTSVDGYFGLSTYRSVKRFERSGELRVDGRVTRRDARVLREAVASIEPGAEPKQATGLERGAVDPAVTGGANYVQVEKATLNPDGTATPPASAPEAVKRIILAGNEIAHKPYRYGGGHARWNDSGYDCSGSVSYALHGAGLLKTPLNSTGFESYGSAGPGQWVTIYANAGHVYMVVAGLRFDTSGAKGRDGSRWTAEQRSSGGFVVRHPSGL